MNRLRNDKGADLIGGKGADGNSGTGGISKVCVATELLFRLIQVSWVPAPLGRSAGMLYRYLWHRRGKKNTLFMTGCFRTDQEWDKYFPVAMD